MKVQRLLEGRYLLDGGAYFSVDTQRCGAYQRAALVWGPALIERNTVIMAEWNSCDTNIYNSTTCNNQVFNNHNYEYDYNCKYKYSNSKYYWEVITIYRSVTWIKALSRPWIKTIQYCLVPISGFGQTIGTTTHFLRHCRDYHCARHIVFEKIKSIDSNISEQNKVLLKKYLLFGANMLNSDKTKYLLVSETAFMQSMETSKSINFLQSKLVDQILSVIIML